MLAQRDPEGTEPRYLQEFLDLPGAVVLEIGCGDGRMTRRYADYAGSVFGIDSDLARLTQALDKPPPNSHFSQASSLALPFAAQTFDRAILAWSL